MVDVDLYLERIGHLGDLRPGLGTLAAIQLRHTLSLPFENLDPLLRRPVRLDLPSLTDKLLRQGRGGYCYEHNVLLQAVLRRLGFQVTGLSARVLWNAPPGVVRARTHMLLKVDLPEGAYLVDTGFGAMTPTAPLRLDTQDPQPTPHEDFRVVREPELLRLEGRVQEEWRPVYGFDLQAQQLPDYEAASWYVSTHPASPFVRVLMAARVTPTGRHVLAGNQLAFHALKGPGERRTVSQGPGLCSVLEEVFGIRLPQTPDLDEMLAAQARGAAAA